MTMRVLHVTWLDSEAANEWTRLEDLDDVLEVTHSVGLVVKESETFILMALSYDPETSSINSFKKIPRLAIISERSLGSIDFTLPPTLS